jgi:hypothetical protein
MTVSMNEVAELARRAAERHAAVTPGGKMASSWLATSFIADVAAHAGLETMWSAYLEIAVAHRAALALQRAVNGKRRVLRAAATDGEPERRRR